MNNNNKVFVGRCEIRETPFGTTETKIGLTKSDLDTLGQNLTDKGWVNVTLKTGKNGNLYLEVLAPKAAAPKQEVPADLPF